jgi:hypothetical protein
MVGIDTRAIARRRRSTLVASLSFFAALAFVAPVHAQTAISAELQRLLATEAWQLDLEITFDASTSSSEKTPKGATNSEQSSLHAEYRESVPLDTRSDGANLSVVKLMSQMQNGVAGVNLQKGIMDFAAEGDNIANWQPNLDLLGDLDNASSEQILKAGLTVMMKPVGNVKFDFKSKVHLEDLYNEVGDHFNREDTMAAGGDAVVARLNQGMVVFEINAAGKRQLIALPPYLEPIASEHGPSRFDWELVTTYSPLPPGPKPAEERKTEKRSIVPGQVQVTDAPVKGGNAGLLFDDPLAFTGGKITGQHTLNATYTAVHINRDPVPGKLVVKYTLTPRP